MTCSDGDSRGMRLGEFLIVGLGRGSVFHCKETVPRLRGRRIFNVGEFQDGVKTRFSLPPSL